MEITGKVISILEPQKFTSKKDGSEIVKHFFVIETQGQYPKKIAFSVLGQDKFNQMGLVVGGTYNVSFDVESREWQGKWFSDVSAWRAIRTDGQQAAQAPQPAASPVPNAQPAQDAQGGGNNDDLPF
jgi:hypothetical protein